jgi:elongation factor G
MTDATLPGLDVSKIRNIALVGPSNSGKTSLVERLAFATGAIARMGSVEAGTTLSDSTDIEHKQGRSVYLKHIAIDHDDYRINLLDTPGYADYVGEVRAGLRAADAALFVVAATDDIDHATAMLWDECTEVGMPRAIVITKSDRDSADVESTIEDCQHLFGPGIAAVHLPLHNDDETVAGLIDLISMQVIDYSSEQRSARAADPEHVALVQDQRRDLIEGIITESEDETLMDRFLAGEDLDTDTLIADLEAAVARGHFYPVLMSAAQPRGFAIVELLDLLTRALPSPLEHALPAVTAPDGSPRTPLECDPQGPLCAEVVKTTSDPYVGRQSLVRVFSGQLTPDTTLHISGHFPRDRGNTSHDIDERVGALTSGVPQESTHAPRASAGDIVSIARLSHAETADTLSDVDYPLLIEPWLVPEPQLPIAITAHSFSDAAKFTVALSRLSAEDPTVRIESGLETGQTILWCMGESHAEVILDRLARNFGVNVDTEEVIVPLRQTFQTTSFGHGRLVKQSGGHGQFAVVDIEVTPLPIGSGVEFVDKVVGGTIPRQYLPAVEKGIREQMSLGVTEGHPLVDLRVTIIDGKAHGVDSSDMAFATAASLALKDAAAQAGLILLEPYDHVDVDIPEEFVGPVMSDLSSRRGRVTGSESADNGRTRISAEVPVRELITYSITLRSISHGAAILQRRFAGYEPVAT